MGKCFQYFGRLYIEYLDYFFVAEFWKLLNGRLSFQALCNTMHYGKVEKFKVVKGSKFRIQLSESKKLWKVKQEKGLGDAKKTVAGVC